MKNMLTNSIARKLMILTVMVTGLVGLTFGNVGNRLSEKNALPCCSVCEENPQAPLCRFGCSPSC